MKENETTCPYCGEIWSIKEIDLQECFNCEYPFKAEENDFEYQKPETITDSD